MEKHVIKKDQSTTVWVDEGNSEWLVEKGVTLGGNAALTNFNFDNVTFAIAGRLISDGDGIVSAGNVDGEAADNTSVKIEASGRILSNDIGVIIQGAGARVENAGVIRSATGQGVDIVGTDVIFDNTGKITSTSTSAIDIEASEGFQIRNDGLLRHVNDGGGNSFAVRLQTSGEGRLVNGVDGVIEGYVSVAADSQGDVTLINKGEITGNGTYAVFFGEGDDRLINRGEMTGWIILGDGDDTVDLRKGKVIDPQVQGGGGDDTFIIDKTNMNILEWDSDGYDTIKTTVSYTLGNTGQDDIEVLQAIGKKAINLTGNDQTNVLNGNAADNELSGGGGVDILRGLGGDDVLTGGLGDLDLFYFGTKSGIDTITDFTIDQDQIRIIKVPGIDKFDDLVSRMSTADFNNDNVDDTIIDLGHGNKIRLADVDKDTLDAADFYIAPVPADPA